VTAFARSLRSLEGEKRHRLVLVVIVVSLLVVAWGLWFFLTPVTEYEVSESARLEVTRATYPIETFVAGRIRTSHLDLGRDVAAGDTLLELDATSLRLELREEASRIAARRPQLAKLRDEIVTKKRALDETREASRAAVQEARSTFEDERSMKPARLHEPRSRKLDPPSRRLRHR
jgi:membrane fusion protein (multidrug efflux system)